MTDEDRHDRQGLLDIRPIIPGKVAVVGVGGIGTYITQACAMAGVGKIVVFDDDVLSQSNLNRLPYPKKWIGRRKTDCINDYIYTIMGVRDVELIAYPHVEAVEDLWPLDGVEFVFITADRGQARNLVTKYCRDFDIPYVNVGYDGNDVSCYKRLLSSSEGEEPDEGGYTVTPSWAAPTMVVAGLAMYFMAYPKTRLPFRMPILEMLGAPHKYRCDECGLETVDYWAYRDHVVSCPSCRKDFHNADAFSTHQAHHCECGFRTCQPRFLKAHRKETGHPERDAQ